MALPIITSATRFISSNNTNNIVNTKDVLNPKSAYHKWLATLDITLYNKLDRKSIRNARIPSALYSSDPPPTPVERKEPLSESKELPPYAANPQALGNTVGNNVGIPESTIARGDYVSPNTIFQHMNKLNWRDREEGLMDARNIAALDKNTWAAILPSMINMANCLYNAIKSYTPVIDDMDFVSQRNFLFHIIAKGSDMYYQTINDPVFCLYLLDDQYQELYTGIINYLR